MLSTSIFTNTVVRQIETQLVIVMKKKTQSIFELGTLAPRDLKIKLKYDLTFLLNRNSARGSFLKVYALSAPQNEDLIFKVAP